MVSGLINFLCGYDSLNIAMKVRTFAAFPLPKRININIVE
jgi:hypothetical protein